MTKDTINCPAVFADVFHKKFVDFTTTSKGPSTQKLEEGLEKFDKKDDNMFAYTTKRTEVFNTVGS